MMRFTDIYGRRQDYDSIKTFYQSLQGLKTYEIIKYLDKNRLILFNSENLFHKYNEGFITFFISIQFSMLKFFAY